LVVLSWAQLSRAEVLPRVVILPFGFSEPKLSMLAETMAEQVASELARSGRVEAMGSNDLKVLLGVERQKQLLGCAEGADQCLAEVSAALGAPWLVTGSIARVGHSVRVDLKLLRSSDGKAAFRAGETLGDEGQLFDAVTRLVAALIPATEDRPGESRPTSGFLRVAPWVVVGLGVASAAGGAVLLGQANTVKQQLSTIEGRATLTFSEATLAVSRAQGWNTGGIVLLSAGGVVALGGALWFALLRLGSAPSPVAVVPTPAGLAIVGVWQ
jgi:TolB-like protein